MEEMKEETNFDFLNHHLYPDWLYSKVNLALEDLKVLRRIGAHAQNDRGLHKKLIALVTFSATKPEYEIGAKNAIMALKFAVHTLNNMEEYLQQYKIKDVKGNTIKNLNNIRIRSADLSKMNMNDLDLRCADLRDVNLDGAMLRGANLSGALLKGTNFGKPFEIIKVDDTTNTCVTFSSHNKMLFRGYEDGLVCVFDCKDTDNGDLLHKFKAHDEAVKKIEILEDNIVTCSDKNVIGIWNVNSQKCIKKIKIDGPIIDDFSVTKKDVCHVIIYLQSGFLWSYCWDDQNTLKKKINLPKYNGKITCFATCGQYALAIAYQKRVVLMAILNFDMKNGLICEEDNVYDRDQSNITTMKWSGSNLAAGAENGSIKVWKLKEDFERFKREQDIAFKLKELEVKVQARTMAPEIYDILTSGDAERLQSLSNNVGPYLQTFFSFPGLRFKRKLDFICEFKGNKQAVTGLAFSDYSIFLVSGTIDGKVRLWGLERKIAYENRFKIKDYNKHVTPFGRGESILLSESPHKINVIAGSYNHIAIAGSNIIIKIREDVLRLEGLTLTGAYGLAKNVEDDLVKGGAIVCGCEETIPKFIVENSIPLIEKAIFGRDIKKEECIGEGSFGKVYRSIWTAFRKPEKVVAVKQLKLSNSAGGFIKKFRNEIKVHSAVKCENIVKFYGMLVSSPYGLVMEYCKNGSLKKLLATSKPSELAWEFRVRFAMDIANGLTYLHNFQPPIIHGDLKSTNVLISDKNRAFLCDFGLSVFKSVLEIDVLNNRRSIHGTLRWLAPELLQPEQQCTTKSDIFSFAIVMWEIATHRIPYGSAELLNNEIITMILESYRETFDGTDAPESYINIVRQCWMDEPKERLSASLASIELNKLFKDFGGHNASSNKDPSYDDNNNNKTENNQDGSWLSGIFSYFTLQTD